MNLEEFFKHVQHVSKLQQSFVTPNSPLWNELMNRYKQADAAFVAQTTEPTQSQPSNIITLSHEDYTIVSVDEPINRDLGQGKK